MDDAETQRFKAASARLMGDMKDAGDAPFRGEVQLDSKVIPPCHVQPCLLRAQMQTALPWYCTTPACLVNLVELIAVPWQLLPLCMTLTWLPASFF